MAIMLQMVPPLNAGIGGVIQGNFGNYQPATDGTYTVDSRDGFILLQQGFVYVKQVQGAYTLPLAPLAAAVGRVVASGALSNGTVAVSNGTDVIRPVTVEVGTGTTAISAGTVTVVYVGNDGQTDTDVLSLVCPLSTSTTQYLSRCVDSISSITVAGVVGGTSPWFRMSTVAQLGVPLAAGAVDFAVQREWDAGATIAVGTLGVSLGSIAPTTAPNGTVTYSFAYSFVSPTS